MSAAPRQPPPADAAASRETIAGGPHDWDADLYHRVSDFQYGLGLEVLDRIPLTGDETVLDAGCGTGRVTLALAERLPRGRVVAVDGSADMVRRARELLPAERCEVRQADLAELRLAPGEAVDAILSTAVFHWVPDHDALFARLYAALRPGGRLVAQCGGEGNVSKVRRALVELREREPFADHLSGWEGPWRFASAAEASERLERAGFDRVTCWLESRTVTLEDPAAYLRTITLGPVLARLPIELRERFVDGVVERLSEPATLDYVRLNIDARRPETDSSLGGRLAGRA